MARISLTAWQIQGLNGQLLVNNGVLFAKANKGPSLNAYRRSPDDFTIGTIFMSLANGKLGEINQGLGTISIKNGEIQVRSAIAGLEKAQV